MCLIYSFLGDFLNIDMMYVLLYARWTDDIYSFGNGIDFCSVIISFFKLKLVVSFERVTFIWFDYFSK